MPKNDFLSRPMETDSNWKKVLKMPQADNISDMLYKNLRLALIRYEARNGCSPVRIFMESDVFRLFRHSEIAPTDVTTFFGIPVKEIKENGYSIFISGEPLVLEAYNLYSENKDYIFRNYEEQEEVQGNE